MSAQNQPTVFDDSLQRRAISARFRGVGNPFAFLNDIGLLPIKEFLYHGANIIDIAEQLNLPITIIQTWIAQNNYGPDIEEASVISAEGYIYQGEKLLKSATTKFDLDKAKALLEHGRFMAGKKNKKVYGTVQDVAAGPAAVSYTFNVGQLPPQALEAFTAQQMEAIEAEYTEVPTVRISTSPSGIIESNISELKPLTAGAAKTPEGIVIHDDMLEALGPKPDYLEPTRYQIKAVEPAIPPKETKPLQHFPVVKDKPKPGHYVPSKPEAENKEVLAEKDKWNI